MCKILLIDPETGGCPDSESEDQEKRVFVGVGKPLSEGEEGDVKYMEIVQLSYVGPGYFPNIEAIGDAIFPITLSPVEMMAALRWFFDFQMAEHVCEKILVEVQQLFQPKT